MGKQRGSDDRIIASDFIRSHWLWLVLAAGLVLAVYIGAVVVWPLFSGVTPAESHEADARAACREEVREQVGDDAVEFEDETAEEFAENTWNIQGAARVPGSEEPRQYECTYTDEELVESELE